MGEQGEMRKTRGKHRGSWASKVAGVIALGVVLVLSAVGLRAEVVIVDAAQDNTLYEDLNGQFSNGSGDYLFAGRTQGAGLRRGLIAFDVAAAVPAGSTIDDVAFGLFMSKTIVGPEFVKVHRALADWGEGASDAPGEEGAGAPAEPGDATWLHTFFPNDFWALEGGDYAATESGATLVDQVGPYEWSDPAMVADVQGWLDDPEQNFGWVLIGNEREARDEVPEQAQATSKRFNTRENFLPYSRPRLRIEFTPPTGLALSITGACPGAIEIAISGATPDGRVGLPWSRSLGSFTVPGGGCAGTDLDLDRPRLLTIVPVDAAGAVTLQRNAPAAVCGVYLQAVDLPSCAVSGVGQIPQ